MPSIGQQIVMLHKVELQNEELRRQLRIALSRAKRTDELERECLQLRAALYRQGGIKKQASGQ